MRHARSKVESSPAQPDTSSEGSNPSPSTVNQAQTPTAVSETNSEGCTRLGLDLIDCSHLWVLDGQLVIRGMVVTGKECTELPWRRKKDGEPASQAEIAREIELVKALYIRSKAQTPSDFADTKLFIREDVK